MEELGTLVRQYETDNSRRRATALIALLLGVIALAVAILLFVVGLGQEPVRIGPFIIGGFVAGFAVVCLVAGVTDGVRCLRWPGEAFRVYENGLVHDYAGQSRTIGWDEIADAQDRAQPYRGELTRSMKIAKALGWDPHGRIVAQQPAAGADAEPREPTRLTRALGRDVHCRIKLEGGDSLVVTGFTHDARHLARTVEQAVSHDIRPSPS